MKPAHEVLGVRPDASIKEVRAAYRRYAARHHPDHGGDPAQFVAGQEAYRQLCGGAPGSPIPGDVRFHRRRSATRSIRRAVTVTTHRLTRRPVPPPRVF